MESTRKGALSIPKYQRTKRKVYDLGKSSLRANNTHALLSGADTLVSHTFQKTDRGSSCLKDHFLASSRTWQKTNQKKKYIGKLLIRVDLMSLIQGPACSA